MALKVYSAPKELGKPPELNFRNWDEYKKRTEQYIQSIQEWAKRTGNGDIAGSLVAFPFADGYAQYIVYTTKPLSLIHVPTGDAWHFPYIERLTLKDIKKAIWHGV